LTEIYNVDTLNYLTLICTTTIVWFAIEINKIYDALYRIVLLYYTVFCNRDCDRIK